MHRFQRTLALVVTLACGAGAAACGSSGSPGGRVAGKSTGVEYAGCMRSHGISNFPDPGSGGAAAIGPDGGVNPQSPAFLSASRACEGLLGVAAAHPNLTESQRLRFLHLAQCMRSHGLPDFPDPAFLPGGGIRISLPPGIVKGSPAFDRAASVCGLPHPPHS